MAHTSFSGAQTSQLTVDYTPEAPGRLRKHARARQVKFSTSDGIAQQHCVNTAEKGERLTLHVYGREALAPQSLVITTCSDFLTTHSPADGPDCLQLHGEGLFSNASVGLGCCISF